MPLRPTVLIVDDHASFRQAAELLLEAAGYDVVGQAATAAEAVRVAADVRPEIVLIDVQLDGQGGRDGFALAEQLAADHVGTVLVMVSSRDAASYGARLTETPARGFLAKSELSGEALAALVG